MRLIVIFSLLSFLSSCENEIYSDINAHLSQSVRPLKVITQEDINHLPELLQTYLINIGQVGKTDYYNVWFYYEFQFKLNADSKWEDASASTYLTAEPLSRDYLMELNSSMGKMSGGDFYYNGNGRMSIRYFSGISLLEEDGPKLDTSELVTVLADFPFCPAFFLLNNLEWHELSDSSLQVTIHDAGIECSGAFYFNEQGYITKFLTNNRYEKETDRSTTPWVVNYSKYKRINEIWIPGYIDVAWVYELGPALYAKGSLSEIEYNLTEYK